MSLISRSVMLTLSLCLPTSRMWTRSQKTLCRHLGLSLLHGVLQLPLVFSKKVVFACTYELRYL